MIKAILFDMGGVIVDLNKPRCISTFKQKCGFDKIEQLLDPCHPRGPFMRMEHGFISESQFIEECLKDCRPGTEAKDIRDSIWSFLDGIEPYKSELIRELSGKYDLYLLSNNNPIVIRRCHNMFRKAGIPMNEVFRKMFISCRMKMLKPDAEIFEAAVAGTGVKACEALFIDDSPTNVAAAQACGIHGLHYVQGTDLRKAIYEKLDSIK